MPKIKKMKIKIIYKFLIFVAFLWFMFFAFSQLSWKKKVAIGQTLPSVEFFDEEIYVKELMQIIKKKAKTGDHKNSPYKFDMERYLQQSKAKKKNEFQKNIFLQKKNIDQYEWEIGEKLF